MYDAKLIRRVLREEWKSAIESAWSYREMLATEATSAAPSPEQLHAIATRLQEMNNIRAYCRDSWRVSNECLPGLFGDTEPLASEHYGNAPRVIAFALDWAARDV